MAGYWPTPFFALLWTKMRFQSVRTQTHVCSTINPGESFMFFFFTLSPGSSSDLINTVTELPNQKAWLHLIVCARSHRIKS